MEESNITGKYFSFLDEGMFLYQNLFLGISPLRKKTAPVSDFNQVVLVPMLTQLYGTSESIWFLLKESKYFEAEILLRVLIEGTIKFQYLMEGDLKTDSKEITEFYVTVPEMQKIDFHKKSVEALSIYNKFDKRPHPFEVNLLSEEELRRLEDKHPKKERKELEQKWAISTLLLKLRNVREEYGNLFGLFYQYFSSSHHVHFSGESVRARALSLQDSVNDTEDKLNVAHGLRIFSNVLTCGVTNISLYCRVFERYDKSVVKGCEELLDVLVEIDEYSRSIIKDYVK